MHRFPQQGAKLQAFEFSGTMKVRMALSYHAADDTVTVVQPGTLRLTNVPKHIGQIYDQQWAKWQL